VVSAVAAIVAARFTSTYQPRAIIDIDWDHLGRAGGFQISEYGQSSWRTLLPTVSVKVTNYGLATARQIQLSVSTHWITRGMFHFEIPALEPGKSFEVEVPLHTIRSSFDHPFELVEETPKLTIPVVKIRWRREYSHTRFRERTVRLGGEWEAFANELVAEWPVAPPRSPRFPD
jgi:hypothetical protein